MLEATKSDLLRLQDPNSNSYFVVSIAYNIKNNYSVYT